MITRSFRDKFARPHRDPPDNNKRPFTNTTSVLKMITRGMRIWTRKNMMTILNTVTLECRATFPRMIHTAIQMSGLRTISTFICWAELHHALRTWEGPRWPLCLFHNNTRSNSRDNKGNWTRFKNLSHRRKSRRCLRKRSSLRRNSKSYRRRDKLSVRNSRNQGWIGRRSRPSSRCFPDLCKGAD